MRGRLRRGISAKYPTALPQQTTISPQLWFVPPERITKFLDWEPMRLLRRQIIAGNQPANLSLRRVPSWKVRELADIDSYIALLLTFAGVTKWENTDYFKRVENLYKRGNSKAGWPDLQSWSAATLRPYLDLPMAIQENGFGPTTPPSSPAIGNNITVYLTKKSDFALVDGKHRLAAARSLGLTSIPVFLIGAHPSVAYFFRT